MQQPLLSLSTVLLLVLMCAVATPAHAQTAAAGPYYATPAWDQKLACTTQANCPRFVVLSNWNNQAVLDRETGLVWERFLNVTSQSLVNASQLCRATGWGNRLGWRLPSIEELQSLVDPGTENNLPPGHPFLGLPTAPNSALYWSTSRSEYAAGQVYVQGFGSVLATLVNRDATELHLRWCVRGGTGAQYDDFF
jgi:hypothetical protein